MTNEEYKKQFEERFYNQLIDDYASEHLYDSVWDFITQALDEAREEAVKEFARWWNGKRIDSGDMSKVIKERGIVYGIRTPEIEEYLSKKGVSDE